MRRRGKRILLVEDHPATRGALELLLKQRGHQLTAAATAAAALALAARQGFDVVISDLGLPDATGHRLMEQLHSLQPGLIGIACSGYGMADDLQRSREAGFAAHLTKPISIEQLESKLQEVAAAALAGSKATDRGA